MIWTHLSMSRWLEDRASSVESVASFLGGGGGAFLRGGPPLNVDVSGRSPLVAPLAVGTVPEQPTSDTNRKPFSSLQQQQMQQCHKIETIRERTKSAPYLRLKNSKRTSKCQVFSSTVPEWEKNSKKNFDFFFKSPVRRIVPKNVKGETLWDFLNIHSIQNRKKLRGPFGDIKKICEKKSHKAEITCTKNFGQGRDSNPRPSAWQTSKNPNQPLCQVPVEVAV